MTSFIDLKYINKISPQLERFKTKKKNLFKREIFKGMNFDLVDIQKIFKILTSSGTAGSTPSRIHLDKENIAKWAKELAGKYENSV